MPENSVDVLRAVDRVDVPWRNGAGVTSEVLTSPAGGADAGVGVGVSAGAGDFDWRLSIATVDSNAVFSTFVGVDRVLMALSEQGLDLIDEGEAIHLDAFEWHAFAGEDSVVSANVLSRTLDLNLMTRRGAFSGTLESHAIADRPWSISLSGADVIVVVVTQGTVVLDGVTLQTLDAIRLDGSADGSAGGSADGSAGGGAGNPATLTLSGLGHVAVARIHAAR